MQIFKSCSPSNTIYHKLNVLLFKYIPSPPSILYTDSERSVIIYQDSQTQSPQIYSLCLQLTIGDDIFWSLSHSNVFFNINWLSFCQHKRLTMRLPADSQFLQVFQLKNGIKCLKFQFQIQKSVKMCHENRTLLA